MKKLNQAKAGAYQSRRFPQMNEAKNDPRIHKLMERAPTLQKGSRVQLQATIAVAVAMLTILGLYYTSHILQSVGGQAEADNSMIIIEPAGEISDSEWMRLIQQAQTEVDAAEQEALALEQALINDVDQLALDHPDTTPVVEIPDSVVVPVQPLAVESILPERSALPVPVPDLGL